MARPGVPKAMPAKRPALAVHAFAALGLLALAGVVAPAAAAPKIRTDADNRVPRCVTPPRLMAFLKMRNGNLDPRFADIAAYYKKHGEAWRVRWDYAFFQMALETNFLSYRRGDGRWGDVDPRQNNFAGLGTTGGGVPGDSYPDVSTGVLAQIQHLVVYSGERIAEPVGARTRLKQDDILVTMASKRGQVTFGDLARRWAADKRYGASIEWVANSYRQTFCSGPQRAEAEPEAPAEAAPPQPVRLAERQPSLPTATNLGGPPPLPRPAPTAAHRGGPPVRTVWQAPTSATGEIPAESPAAIDEPSMGTVKTTPPSASRAAPLPTRNPVRTAAIDAAPAAPPPAVTATVATGPDADSLALPNGGPHAFAYGAAMAAHAAAGRTNAAASAGSCRVLIASYGGDKALLVRSAAAAETRYTVLTVLEGFEASMLDNYVRAHAPGGESIGTYPSKEAALLKAKALCQGTPTQTTAAATG